MRFYKDSPSYSQDEIDQQIKSIQELQDLKQSPDIIRAIDVTTKTLLFMLDKNKRWEERQGK